MTVVTSFENRSNTFSKFIKFSLDRIMAAIALLLFIPVVLVMVVLIYFQMDSPVIFTQVRAGRNGDLFTIYKFRTMTNECDSNGNLLPDEDRITPLGEFLRKTRLDEILQFWNILKGEMSFVGPRPTVPEQLEDYDYFQKCRLLEIPGMTGWHQVNGNNELTWEERICLDIWYLENWSLWLDFVILIKTFAVITLGEERNEKLLAEARRFEKYFRSENQAFVEVL
ncbi:MAG: sugar transferase [Scytonematopsis contorta HA4267-MV1]|jgi:lipopolysaccharide/colanic/teichoic acid biosynthesis glycosyltransferase|nr:sugar transferase [Scytonematopsis contorta HA4267-MV1]